MIDAMEGLLSDPGPNPRRSGASALVRALHQCDTYVAEHPASPAYGVAECEALRAVIRQAAARYGAGGLEPALVLRLERDWLPSMPRLASS